MKAILNISLLALLVLSSCTSSLYTGTEYDDLYFTASDKPVAKVRPSVRDQISDQNQNAVEYYDNIYAADTLVADEYADAVDIDNQIVENNNRNNGYEYYDNYSYTGRLNRFYGNYFDPYWRDPYYFDYGYGGYGGFGFPSYSMGMGYGGYPWSYNFYSPYYYDQYSYYNPFYNYGRYSRGYYGGYYGGFFGNYYGGYGNYGGGYYASESRDYVPYGRTERASSMSSRWNSNTGATGSGRRDSYLSTGGSSVTGRRVASDNKTITTIKGRTASPNTISKPVYSQADRKAGQSQTGTENMRSNSGNTQRNAVSSKPSYSDVNRSYTPSYSSPRMSTRPAYNNSRVSESVNSGTMNRSNGAINSNRVNTNPGTTRTPVNQGNFQNYNNSNSNSNSSRSNSSVGGTQRRVDAPTGYSSPASGSRSNVSNYRSTESYSVPSRSSVESRSYPSGSYNNSSSGSRSSSYSGGSSNYSSGSSSYSGGSSSSGSSSGSSGSSGSSSSSSGSSGSSSGRR
jgi:hypothetical protein